MADRHGDYDATSDQLIDVLVDRKNSKAARSKAAKDLHDRHSNWVIQQIGRKVFNPDDVQDIAQQVWMIVLQPDKLGAEYTNKTGQFRSYLRAPIRWSILKHIDKLPFSLNDEGNKVAVQAVDVSDAMLEQGLERSLLQEVIENVIKPNLIQLGLRDRNIYVLNEHDVLFDADPLLAEVADINGLSYLDAQKLLDDAGSKAPDECTDEELSVYLPMRYRALIDVALLKKSSGRYLSALIGVTESVFRKRLHTARKTLVEIVRANLPGIAGDYGNG